MKRLCTDEEKNYLKENYEQLLEGVAKNSAHFKVGDIFVVLIVLSVIMIAFTDLFAKVLPKFVLFLLALILTFFINNIVHAILITFRTNRVKRRFFLHQRFYINGATVVKLHETLLTLDFTYIEDDEFLYDHTPYGVKLHSLRCDIGELTPGDRLLLIYADDDIDNPKHRTFQMMRMPPEWASRIIAEKPLSDDYEKITKHLAIYPHPNGVCIQKEPLLLDTEEARRIGALLDKEGARSLCTVMFGIMAVLFVTISLAIGILLMDGNSITDIFSGLGVIFLGAPLAVSVTIPIVLTFILKKSRRNQGRLTHVQEVLFKDYLVGSRGQTTTVFYEWDGTKYKETEHKNLGIKGAYGDVVTKYIYENGAALYKKKVTDETLCDSILSNQNKD